MADDRDVVLGVRTEGTAEAAAEFAKVAEAENRVGSAAASMSGAADAAAAATEKQITAIRNSGQSLAVQRAALEGVKDGLRDVGAAEDVTGTKAAALTAAIARVDRELNTIANESAQTFTGVERGFQSWEQAVARYQAKLESGATTSERDIKAIIRAEELLNIELEKTGTELGQLSATAQRRFTEVKAATEDAIVTERKLKDAFDDQKGRLAEAGQQWTGLGDAIGVAAGKYGAAIGQIGLATAAFQQGFQIGQQLNQLFGTDMSEWDAAVKSFGATVGNFLKRISDDAVGLATLIGDLVSGNFEAFKRDAAILRDDIRHTWDTITDGAPPAKAAVQGVTAAHDEHATSAGKAKTALEQLADAIKASDAAHAANAAAIAKTNAGLQDWIVKANEAHATMQAIGNMSIAAAVGQIDAVTGALDKMKNSANAAADAIERAANAGLNTNEGGSSIRGKSGITNADGSEITPKAPGSYNGSGFGGAQNVGGTGIDPTPGFSAGGL